MFIYFSICSYLFISVADFILFVWPKKRFLEIDVRFWDVKHVIKSKMAFFNSFFILIYGFLFSLSLPCFFNSFVSILLPFYLLSLSLYVSLSPLLTPLLLALSLYVPSLLPHPLSIAMCPLSLFFIIFSFFLINFSSSLRTTSFFLLFVFSIYATERRCHKQSQLKHCDFDFACFFVSTIQIWLEELLRFSKTSVQNCYSID